MKACNRCGASGDLFTCNLSKGDKLPAEFDEYRARA